MPITALNHQEGVTWQATTFLAASPSIILLNAAIAPTEESSIADIIASEVFNASYAPQAYSATGAWNVSANKYVLGSSNYLFTAGASTISVTHFVLWLNRSLVPYKTVGSIDTAANTITSTAHGFTNGDRIVVTSSGSLPGGLSSSTRYWAKVNSVNVLELHTNSGLTAIADITSTGSGTILLRNANGFPINIYNTGGTQSITAGNSWQATVSSITFG